MNKRCHNIQRFSALKLCKGFTLIEVLLAMSITAIAAIMAYQSMDSAARLSEVSQKESDALQRLSTAMFFISKDFRHIAQRKVRNPNGDGFDASFSYNEFSVPNLMFTRSGKLNPQIDRFQRSHLERVAYHLDDEKLIRYSWPMVDHYDEEPQEVVLFEGVKQFKLELTNFEPDPNNLTAVRVKKYQQWPAEAFSEDKAALPQMLELLLETERWGVIRRKFEVVDREVDI